MFIFLIFVCLCAINSSQFSSLDQKIRINLKFQKTTFQLSKLIGAMYDLLLSQWLSFENSEIYSTITENKMRASKAIQQLTKNTYKQMIYDIFPKQSIDSMLYLSYCRTSIYYQECQKIKGGLLTNGLATMAPFIIKDYQSLIMLISLSGNSLNNVKYYKDEVCQKLVIYYNFTNQLYGKSLIKSYQIPINQSQKNRQTLKIIQILIIITLIVTLTIFAFSLIRNGIKYRKEVFSIDTKTNLYQQQEKYRPYLNELFYNQEST